MGIRTICFGPSYYYNFMRKLYRNEKYYDALFICGNALLEFPEYFKNDWYLLFTVKNFYRLHLINNIQNYKTKFKNEYKKSTSLNYWYYEEIVQWNNKNNEDSLTFYFDLLKKNQKVYTDSLVAEAQYLMAENRIKNNDITEALRYLDSIPEKYSIKLFADIRKCIITNQANTITINKVKKDISSIKDSLSNKNIIAIYDFVFHFIHNEQVNACDFDKSFYSTSLLNKTERWYSYALCYYENMEWKNCLIECNNVINFNGRAKLHARLLKTKCLNKLGKPDSAKLEINTLDSLITEIKNREVLEREELILNHSDILKKQDSLGIKVDSLMNNLQSSYILMQIDSLKPILEENISKIKRYNELVHDEYKRTYDPFNIDILHEEVKKLLKEFKNIDLKSEDSIETNSLQD